MVKKGGNGSNRGKFNQRGRPNGGGMNDFRNRSQPSNGSFGGAGNQRPMSRFSNAQNGTPSYQPRPYQNNGSAAGANNPAQRSAYVPRSTPSSYPPKTNGYFDAANGTANPARTNGAEQSKYSGFQSKPPSSVISNAYSQSSHQSYPSAMATGMQSMYSLPPPAFNSVQSVPFNYPPPVLPVKN